MRAGEFIGNKNLLHDVFSFSKLNTYAKCPQRAKFRYIDGRKESGLHLARGRAGHAGQEVDNRAKLRGEALSVQAVLEAAVAVLEEELEQEPEVGGLVQKSGVKDSFARDHKIHLEAFEESGERDRIRPIEGTVEAPFEMDLTVGGEGAKIQGFLDVLSHGEHQPVVVDYKTVKRPVSVGDAEKSLQFELYRKASSAGSVRVVSFVESGRQRATTRVVETPPRGAGGPAQERLMTWMAKTIQSFRRSLETGDWPRCSPESYWCSPSACGFFGECYPKRAPGLERLVKVEAIRPPGSLPMPEWRGIHGGGDTKARRGDAPVQSERLGSVPGSSECDRAPGEEDQGAQETSGLVGEHDQS